MRRTSLSFLVVLALGLVLITAGCTQNQPEAAASMPGSTQVTLTSAPDIVGVWTGTTAGFNATLGFREGNTSRYYITEQKGPVFTGYKEYSRGDGIIYSENLSGVIAGDGEIYMVEHDSGYTIGDFIGPDEIELRHLQDGDAEGGDVAVAFIINLNREKN
jgi:ABC-type transport system substrate-binding protein